MDFHHCSMFWIYIYLGKQNGKSCIWLIWDCWILNVNNGPVGLYHYTNQFSSMVADRPSESFSSRFWLDCLFLLMYTTWLYFLVEFLATAPCVISAGKAFARIDDILIMSTPLDQLGHPEVLLLSWVSRLLRMLDLRRQPFLPSWVQRQVPRKAPEV